MTSTKRKNRLAWVLLTTVIGACFGYFSWFWQPTYVESMETSSGIELKFRTQGDRFEIFRNQRWQPFFVKGINVGASLPGYYPGELPLKKEDYLRWFAMIDEMGVNVIRIYTIHQPVFYEALVEYNKQKEEDPLYLMQGIWSPEEKLIEQKDAFLPEIREEFRQEIKDAVGAVYGSVTIPEKPGKASGTYSANAGQYLIGWHIGTEWDPLMVRQTNKLHQQKPDYAGIHFGTTAQATAFEKWLAEMLDCVAEQENRHGWQHPVTFTNWVTTDPLAHPGEPLLLEDLVSVDPTHIAPINWEAGYFAAYHVYPYYPDFFRLDQTLQNVKNDSGQIDTYKAYLQQLKAHHPNMPVMVTEFGVPSSWGTAHLGQLGRDQGGHSEREQGEINAALLHEIYSEGYAGAILFAWQDEWFKKTWNTMRFEQPADRSAYWLNVLTNESMFGVLGMQPSKEGLLTIDGDAEDWDKLKPEEKQQLDLPSPGWKEVWATHDEGYLYVMAKLNKPFNPEQEKLFIGVDTIPGGNRHAPELAGRTLDEGLEVLVTLGNERESEAKIASNYDFHTRLYGNRYRMKQVTPQEMKDDSGVFNPWKLAVGLEMQPPDSKQYWPMEEVVAGKLVRGTTDRSDPGYNSLSAWQTKEDVVELRIPWMLLGFTDPSSLQVMSYREQGNQFITETTKGIRLLPWIIQRNGGEATERQASGTPFPLTKLPRYQWQPWDRAKYTEQKKISYDIMQKTFSEIDSK